jgi:hypothetical protein
MISIKDLIGVPDGIRTHVIAVKGRKAGYRVNVFGRLYT